MLNDHMSSDGPSDEPGRPRQTRWPVVFGILAIIAVLAVCAFIFVGRKPTHPPSATDPTTSTSAASSTSTSPRADSGPAFPGKLPNDLAALPGDPITLAGGISVTAGPIEGVRYDDRQLICSRVVIHNAPDRINRFSYTDWKLQLPSQKLQSATVTQGATVTQDNNTLETVDLAAGDTAEGTVCFNDDSGRICPTSCLQAGTYVLLMHLDWLPEERMAWVNEVSSHSGTAGSG